VHGLGLATRTSCTSNNGYTIIIVASFCWHEALCTLLSSMHLSLVSLPIIYFSTHKSEGTSRKREENKWRKASMFILHNAHLQLVIAKCEFLLYKPTHYSQLFMENSCEVIEYVYNEALRVALSQSTISHP